MTSLDLNKSPKKTSFRNFFFKIWEQYTFLSIHCVPPTMPDQCSSLPLCLAVLSAQGVSRTTLMCGDTWQARWPLGLSLITLDPNPSGIKPAKPNSHCGSWLASAETAAGGRGHCGPHVSEICSVRGNVRRFTCKSEELMNQLESYIFLLYFY